MKLNPLMDQIPQGVQGVMNGGAVIGAWASFVGLIQDTAGAVAAVLSVVWLGLQIYSWWEKRRKP